MMSLLDGVVVRKRPDVCVGGDGLLQIVLAPDEAERTEHRFLALSLGVPLLVGSSLAPNWRFEVFRAR